MRGITVFRSVAGGFGGGPWRRPRRSAQQPCHASSAPQPGGGDKLSVRSARDGGLAACSALAARADRAKTRLMLTAQVWRSPLAKAAYTNASLAVAGDFIAQARPTAPASF
jgi:hypothetical protein